MREIMEYIFKKYGLKLSENEISEYLDWFKNNKNNIINEEEMDKATEKYLYEKYKGRPVYLCEEDLSNMKYLLSLLKEKTKNR